MYRDVLCTATEERTRQDGGWKVVARFAAAGRVLLVQMLRDRALLVMRVVFMAGRKAVQVQAKMKYCC